MLIQNKENAMNHSPPLVSAGGVCSRGRYTSDVVYPSSIFDETFEGCLPILGTLTLLDRVPGITRSEMVETVNITVYLLF